MLNRTGRRAGLTASPWAWRGVVLAGALVAAQPAVTFGAGVDTYQWLGELVALDEGARSLTVTSRVVAPEGLDVAGLEPGDPILITWSGSEHGAQAISAVVADDGSGLSPRDHFRLRARFVAADATRQSLTFSVSGPSSELARLRATTQGTWATVTSPHRPAHGPAAVVTADAYGAGDGHGPAPGDQYRWHGELVSLDNAGRLTVKARLASPTAAAAGLEAGDAIRITWSGFRERASGIRAVVPADDSGLWGSERFLLEAELVAIDQRYLTFSVEPPADSIAAIRALTPGAWATATSSHQPMAAADAVEAVAAYAASPADVPRTADATYRWHGELVSLDDAASSLTVKSRLVTDAAAESAADLDAGDPIVITWSGFENRTDGIRVVERDAGLWGDGGFLLQATFVETDSAGRYMTFSVEPPADRVRGLRAMTRGSWATLTSHHRPAAGDSPVLTVDAYAPSTAPRLAGMAPAADDTYEWRGELVSRDEEAGTLTVRSRIVAPSGTVADDLDAGDPIVITWSGFEDRADGIRAVKRDDGSGLWGNDRFLLQAAFAAVEGRYLTFTVEPPADSARMMQGLTPGAWASRDLAPSTGLRGRRGDDGRCVRSRPPRPPLRVERSARGPRQGQGLPRRLGAGRGARIPLHRPLQRGRPGRVDLDAREPGRVSGHSVSRAAGTVGPEARIRAAGRVRVGRRGPPPHHLHHPDTRTHRGCALGRRARGLDHGDLVVRPVLRARRNHRDGGGG